MAAMFAPRLSAFDRAVRLVASLAMVLGVFTISDEAQAAAPAQRFKVLGMQIEGSDLSAKDKLDLFNVVQTKLGSYPQVDLVKPPERELTDEMIDLECIDIDADCLGRLGKKYKAERVFYSQVDKAAKGGYTLLVRVVDATLGKVIHNTKSTVSSRMGLANALEIEVAKVFGTGGTAPPPKSGFGYLEVKTNLQDAKIFVGKEFAATGEVKLKQKVGKYTVRVEHDGYQPQLFQVEVSADKTTTRSVTLLAVGGGTGPGPVPAGPEAEPEVYETWWFWTIIGVVVAGGVAGIVVATTSDDGGSAVGNVSFSVDPAKAWQDRNVQGGR